MTLVRSKLRLIGINGVENNWTILLLALLTILVCQTTTGQVATIQDKDGWTNVRKSPGRQSEIIQKIHENQVFLYNPDVSEEMQDWVSVYIPKNNFSLGKSEPDFIVGFIHRSRLLPLEKLKEYSKEEFSFQYKIGPFNIENRVIDKQDDKWVTAIDGRPVWGTDGGLPRTQVNGIQLKIEGKEIEIHKVFFSDIYECDNKFTVYKNRDTYFVYQWNSDGAGAYVIVWVLDKMGVKQRFIGTIN